MSRWRGTSIVNAFAVVTGGKNEFGEIGWSYSKMVFENAVRE